MAVASGSSRQRRRANANDLIAEGKNARQAARHLGRSYETVRNQLKSIFDKTDTRRQSALAILVVRMEQRSQ